MVEGKGEVKADSKNTVIVLISIVEYECVFTFKALRLQPLSLHFSVSCPFHVSMTPVRV